MRARVWFLAVALGVALVPTMASAHQHRGLNHGQHLRALDRIRPRGFASCAALVHYARRELGVSHGVPEPVVTPLAGSPAATPPTAGAPSASAGPGGGSTTVPSYSTTNNQEPGVDEPDIVKTNGSTVFAVSQRRLYAIDVTGAKPRLVGSLDLGPSGYNAQLLLSGARLIAISSAFPVAVGGPSPPVGIARANRGGSRVGGSAAGAGVAAPGVSPAYYSGQTIVTEIDVHDPAAMSIARTMTVDGAFVDARQNGSTARLVISSQPRAVVDPALRGRASGWVPVARFHSRVTGRRSVGRAVACDQVSRPAQFSGLGMLTILTVDLSQGLYATSSEALMADARVVYGSLHSLYVATEKWIDPAASPYRIPPSATTVIDRFDTTDPRRTTYVASGEVPGFVLNQFSMSEYNHYLRVATTSRPIWWGGSSASTPSQSYVTVLTTQGHQLVPVGQVSGLGAGEQIYSVRFIENAGYVVTFRRVDPLYTIDLSSPTQPRVAGKLELSGYSSYLHPVGDGLLLGIGQDVGANNEPAGSQLELFDVSNPRAPKLLQHTSLGDFASSEAQYDHHAFLFWPPTQLAMLPVQINPLNPTGPPTPVPGRGGSTGTTPSFSSQSQFTGAIGFHVARSGISEVGRITHDPINGYSPPIHRAVVLGDQLFTVSDAGVLASNLQTLARETFIAFPPQPVLSTGVTPPRKGVSKR